MKKWYLLASLAVGLAVPHAVQAQGCLSGALSTRSFNAQTSVATEYATPPGATQIYRGTGGHMNQFDPAFSAVGQSYVSTDYSPRVYTGYAASAVVPAPVATSSFVTGNSFVALNSATTNGCVLSNATVGLPLISSTDPLLNAASAIVPTHTVDSTAFVVQPALTVAPAYFNGATATWANTTTTTDNSLITNRQAFRLVPSADSLLNTVPLNAADVGQPLILERHSSSSSSTRVTNTPTFEEPVTGDISGVTTTDTTAASSAAATLRLRQTVTRRRHLVYPDGRVVSGPATIVGTRDLAELRLSASQVANLRSVASGSSGVSNVIDLRSSATNIPAASQATENAGADRLKTIEDTLEALTGEDGEISTLKQRVGHIEQQYSDDRAAFRRDQAEFKQLTEDMQRVIRQIQPQ